MCEHLAILGKPSPSSDRAQVTWNQPARGGVIIHLATLNGTPVKPWFRGGPKDGIMLPPGSHRFTLLLTAGDLEAQREVSLEAVAGHHYRVEADADGLQFSLAIRDLAAGQPASAIGPVPVAGKSSFQPAWTDTRQR